MAKKTYYDITNIPSWGGDNNITNNNHNFNDMIQIPDLSFDFAGDYVSPDNTGGSSSSNNTGGSTSPDNTGGSSSTTITV